MTTDSNSETQNKIEVDSDDDDDDDDDLNDMNEESQKASGKMKETAADESMQDSDSESSSEHRPAFKQSTVSPKLLIQDKEPTLNAIYDRVERQKGLKGFPTW